MKEETKSSTLPKGKEIKVVHEFKETYKSFRELNEAFKQKHLV